MKRLAAFILTAFILFSFASCDQANISDEITPSTPFDTADSSTEHDNVESDDKIDSNDSLDQAIFDSVSPLIDHDTLYNEEFPRRYNFISDTTGYFFQFRFFGSENRLVYLLKTKDGGKTWVAQDIQIPSSMGWREHVICAKMLDENVGLISGTYGPSENFSDRTYITADGGKTWSKIVLPKDAPGIISERSNDLATYSECEAYGLTHENGVYFLCVRDAYYNPESDNSTYNYFRFSSTDLVSWTFVDSTNSAIADFSSYEAIIETYKSIVNCFPEYSVEQYRNQECIYALEFGNEESRDIYEKLFFSAFYHYKDDYAVQYLDDGRNYFGYALYDINNNGSNELILLNDRYDIIAIFSNINGTPRLIIDNQPFCRIDSSGKIYTQKIIKETHTLLPWTDSYYNIRVYTLNEHDELTVAEEYIADNSFGDDQMCFNVTDGKSIEITKDEFLIKTHGYLYNSEAACITQSSIFLDFIRLFEPIRPYLPDIYCWQWQENKYNGSSIVTITYMNDTEVYIGFYSGKWIHEANVTATCSGESAYFESEKLSGRLEFGLDSIWIVITESEIQSFPCGAYIYEYYEIHI